MGVLSYPNALCGINITFYAGDVPTFAGSIRYPSHLQRSIQNISKEVRISHGHTATTCWSAPFCFLWVFFVYTLVVSIISSTSQARIRDQKESDQVTFYLSGVSLPLFLSPVPTLELIVTVTLACLPIFCLPLQLFQRFVATLRVNDFALFGPPT